MRFLCIRFDDFFDFLDEAQRKITSEKIEKAAIEARSDEKCGDENGFEKEGKGLAMADANCSN